MSDTIFALASGAGVSGVAVIRISGPEADGALVALTQEALPEPRRAALRRVRAADGGHLDDALVIRFRPGASFTGEAVVELHCHGGRAVTAAVLSALAGLPGLRAAEAGEFTRRAFENGRVDLIEVDALADLVAAETEEQRRQALMGTALSRRASAWRDRLLEACALVEVTIDWVDEEVPEDVRGPVLETLRVVRGEMETQLAGASAAERLRDGYEVALIGAPNAGKSTLFNAIAGRDAALTSPVPGTTRDVIELRYDLGGLPVIFLDLAGIREASDQVEVAGIDRALARAMSADLRVFLDAMDARLSEEMLRLWRAGDLRVWSKADLGGNAEGVAVSAEQGVGIADLLARIETTLAGRAREASLVSHLRQREALENTVSRLAEAESGLAQNELDLAADALRRATLGLGRLMGQTGVEDILDQVFSRFCLGK